MIIIIQHNKTIKNHYKIPFIVHYGGEDIFNLH